MMRSFVAFAGFAVLLTVIAVSYWKMSCPEEHEMTVSDFYQVMLRFNNKNASMGSWIGTHGEVNVVYVPNDIDKAKELRMDLTGTYNGTYEMTSIQILDADAAKMLTVKSVWRLL